MRALSTLIVLGVSILSSPVIAESMVPSSATESLLSAHPGLRVMAQGERAVALYNVAFATDADPGTSTDQFVQGFLDVYADALGVDDVTMVPAPGAVLLGVLGLAMAGWKARRRQEV